MKSEEDNGVAEIYSSFINLIGYENTLKVYEEFSGQQITFPKRFYKAEHMHSKIKNMYDGKNLKQLAKKFGYTERYLRKIVSDEG